MNPALIRRVYLTARRSLVAFDVDAYVWRYVKSGRELTADEVEDLGYDAGLRDSPETWAPRYVPTEETHLGTITGRLTQHDPQPTPSEEVDRAWQRSKEEN